MSNQITCPRCKRIIANNPVIDQAANREGDDTHNTSPVSVVKELGIEYDHTFCVDVDEQERLC